MRKHSSVSAKNNNEAPPSTAAAVDWKSLDDADSSSSQSDEKGDHAAAVATVNATAEMGPDLVRQCNGGISPTNAPATAVVGPGVGVSAAEKK